MDKPMEIALLTRRFRLLSRRPDLLYAKDPAALYERVVEDNAVPLMLLDKSLLVSIEPLDRVCARAVQLLGRKGTRRRELLELLDVLDADYAVAILCALPDEAQREVRREPEWGRAMQRVQDELVEAMEDVDTFGRLLEGQSTPADHAWPFGPGRPRIPDELRTLAEAT